MDKDDLGGIVLDEVAGDDRPVERVKRRVGAVRIKPGPKKEELLQKEWRSVYYVWNQCVAWGEFHRANSDNIMGFDWVHEMGKRLTGWRKKTTSLRQCSRAAQEHVIQQYRTAYSAAHKEGLDNWPVIKDGQLCLPVTEYPTRSFSVSGRGNLRLAGGLTIPCRTPIAWKRDPELVPKFCVVYADEQDRWYVAFSNKPESEGGSLGAEHRPELQDALPRPEQAPEPCPF